jgi:hypothetical protein
MGIDVYLKWYGQTPEETEAQQDVYLALDGGGDLFQATARSRPVAAKNVRRPDQ